MFVFFPLVLQAPIIPVVFSSYSNFYLRKEKQFKSGDPTDDVVIVVVVAAAASSFPLQRPESGQLSDTLKVSQVKGVVLQPQGRGRQRVSWCGVRKFSAASGQKKSRRTDRLTGKKNKASHRF